MIRNLEVLKFILVCYYSFNAFKKKNYKFFNYDKEFLFFSFFTLIKIFYLVIFNKIKLIFNIYERNKFFYCNRNFFYKYKFSVLWSKSAIYHWDKIFTKFKLYNKKISILEIGSYEGFSTLFF